MLRKVRLRPKDDRFRWGRNDPRQPASSFLPVGRTLFITRGTKDYILLTDQNDRCDAFATTHNKPGGGAIRKRVHPSVFPIPAKKSCSSQSRANDLTQRTMKMKSVFTVNIAIALLSIAAFAQTPPAPPQAPQPPRPPHPPGMPGHDEKRPRVPVTYLGVDTSQVPTVVSDQLGLAKGFGLVVDYVEPNSPAATAGVQQNDILKMLNDQILIEPSQLRKLLQTFPEGTEVTLTVLRKGQEQKLTAKLAKKEVPQRRGAFPGGNRDWHWDFDATGDLNEQMGEQMQNLKEQLKEQLGDQRGIIREAVTQAHEAARRARDDARRAADQLGIFFEDSGAVKASKIDLGKAQIVFSDDKGELKLANVDGRKLLTVKDPQGKLVFSGPVETKEDLDKMPADVRQRYDRLQQNDLPTVAPRSDTDSADDADTDDADDEDEGDDKETAKVSQQGSFQSSTREMIPHSISF
jgi:serine protease Do